MEAPDWVMDEELPPLYAEELLECIVTNLKIGDDMTPVQIYRTMQDIRSMKESREDRKKYKAAIRVYSERLNSIIQKRIYK